jgi:hypothetical protein
MGSGRTAVEKDFVELNKVLIKSQRDIDRSLVILVQILITGRTASDVQKEAKIVMPRKLGHAQKMTSIDDAIEKYLHSHICA